MKKIISVILVAAMTFSLSMLLASCNKNQGQTNDTTEETTTSIEEETTKATVEEETETETAAPAPITEGAIDISGLVSIELKDGWYTKEGLDTTWNEVKLENESITDFLANVSVKVGTVYGEDHAAEWAQNIQGNYGGKGTVTTEEIVGHTFYHLSGVVDDDTQNIYFCDLDDSHYLEVDIMFMEVSEGLPVFDLLTFTE